MIDYIPFREQEKESLDDINFLTANYREDEWSLESPFGLFNTQPKLPDSIDYIFDWHNPSETYWEGNEVRRTKKKRQFIKEHSWLLNDRVVSIEEIESSPMETQCICTDNKECTNGQTLVEEAKTLVSLDSLKIEESTVSNNKTLNTETNKEPLYQVKEERKTKELHPNTQRKKCCNCKNSKCLKLYCECFASQGYCSECNCVDCHNTPEYKQEIRANVTKITKKNPMGIMRNQKESTVGCNCKRSECRKNYCYCYKNNKKCEEYCKCMDCRNNLDEQSTV
jgi:hypothetical protein